MSIDHSAFMDQVAIIWGMVNTNGILAFVMTVGCLYFTYRIVRGLFDQGFGEEVVTEIRMK